MTLEVAIQVALTTTASQAIASHSTGTGSQALIVSLVLGIASLATASLTFTEIVVPSSLGAAFIAAEIFLVALMMASFMETAVFLEGFLVLAVVASLVSLVTISTTQDSLDSPPMEAFPEDFLDQAVSPEDFLDQAVSLEDFPALGQEDSLDSLETISTTQDSLEDSLSMDTQDSFLAPTLDQVPEEVGDLHLKIMLWPNVLLDVNATI